MTVAVKPENRESIEAAFWTFHRDHPEVYVELRALAREAVAAGQRRLGIGMLFEVLRWQRMIASTGTFKLNNNYRAYYARMLMRNCPDLEGVFNTRQLAVPQHVAP